MAGQRERVGRIFLAGKEGGLNLGMNAPVSKRLMGYGRDMGRLFVTQFNFNEHRWRRLLTVHRTQGDWLKVEAAIWSGGFGAWYAGYRPHVRSYGAITKADRKRISDDLDVVAAATGALATIARPERKYPRNSGELRIAPRYLCSSSQRQLCGFGFGRRRGRGCSRADQSSAGRKGEARGEHD